MDRNRILPPGASDADRRPPRGGVDRNSNKPGVLAALRRSSPTRGRGSKLHDHGLRLRGERVVPHAGAWIETSTTSAARSVMRAVVVPHAGGVDRNQPMLTGGEVMGVSSPTRGRGSKHRGGTHRRDDDGGVPHAGAWIENCASRADVFDNAGRPNERSWTDLSDKVSNALTWPTRS